MTSPPPSLTRIYGFVVMLSAQCAGLGYVFLALAPDVVAEELVGNNLAAIRQVCATVLVVIGVTIFYAFSSYALLVQVLMPGLEDKCWVTDSFARPVSDATSSSQLGDLSKTDWSRRLVVAVASGATRQD